MRVYIFEVKTHGSLHDEHIWNGLGKLLGNIVFEEMPLNVRKNYVGADKAYEEYKIRHSNGQEKDEAICFIKKIFIKEMYN